MVAGRTSQNIMSEGINNYWEQAQRKENFPLSVGISRGHTRISVKKNKAGFASRQGGCKETEAGRKEREMKGNKKERTKDKLFHTASRKCVNLGMSAEQVPVMFQLQNKTTFDNELSSRHTTEPQ